MKTKFLTVALGALVSMNASAIGLSDYLDSQYEISWANETVLPEVMGSVGIDPLAQYDTEGNLPVFSETAYHNGSVVDIAAMEIVTKREAVGIEGPLFVETYE